MTAHDPGQPDVTPAARKPRLRVADDDIRILELLQFALTGNGFEVLVATDGDEAWDILSRQLPDLAILDVKMPRRTGFDLVEKVRADERLSPLPLILVSGNADTEFRLSGLSKGADDFLVKPFSPKELMLKCCRLLERTEVQRGLLRARARLEQEVGRAQGETQRMAARLRREQCVKEALLGLTRELSGSPELDSLLHTFVITLMGQLNVGSVALFMPSPGDAQHFVPQVARGIPPERLREARFRVSGPLAATLLVESRALRVRELENWNDLRRDCGLLNTLGTALLAPIISNNALLGLVALGERADGADFPRDDVEMLHSLCSASAVAVENARLFRDLEESTISTIGALVTAMEAKDPYSRGHTERVARYSVVLARALELPQAEVESIHWGALLHDVGKIGILDAVLNKPGLLTEEERQHVQEHAEIGSNIVRHLRYLASAREIVRHHHERVDGKGYPDGVMGDRLGLGSRIVAVADSFDAMTTHRPYRPAMSVAEVLRILKEGSGTQYDPAVVEVLIAEVQAGRIRPPVEMQAAA